jgi:hypothetical protein
MYEAYSHHENDNHPIENGTYRHEGRRCDRCLKPINSAEDAVEIGEFAYAHPQCLTPEEQCRWTRRTR